MKYGLLANYFWGDFCGQCHIKLLGGPNLFAVHPTINMRIKTVKGIASFLKPSRKDYAPEKYLDYDYKKYMFHPSSRTTTYKKKISETLRLR